MGYPCGYRSRSIEGEDTAFGIDSPKDVALGTPSRFRVFGQIPSHSLRIEVESKV